VVGRVLVLIVSFACPHTPHLQFTLFHIELTRAITVTGARCKNSDYSQRAARARRAPANKIERKCCSKV